MKRPGKALLLVALLAPLAIGQPRAEAAGPTAPPFVTTWGASVDELEDFEGFGTDPGRFDTPEGLAVGPDGTVYVGDTRVQRFTRDGVLLGEFGDGPGTGPGQFARARSIVTDHLGFVYVLDSGNGRIQKFQPDGTFVTDWDEADGNPLIGPTALAFGGPDRHLYAVASYAGGAATVYEFNRSGGFIDRFDTTNGNSAGQTDDVFGIGVGPAGQIYLADQGNDRVQEFTMDGTFVRQWGTSGSGPGQMDSPARIAVDADGDVWVTDWPPNNRIQVFSPTGTFKFSFGTVGLQLGQFRYPGQVAFGRHGRVYVVEENNHRVSLWSRPLTDARIRRGTGGALAGNDVHNTTGANQTRVGTAPRGGSVSFYVSVQNDVPEAEAFRLKGQAGNSRFRVRYFAGATNVTAQVVAGTYTTPELVPGRTHTIRAQVSVAAGTPRRATLTRTVTARADTDPARADRVRFTTTRT